METTSNCSTVTKFKLHEDDNGEISTNAEPIIRSHLPDCFEKRVWLEIEHRYLAFHMVKLLFCVSLRDSQISYQQLLAYSYTMLSPCRERNDFLFVLVQLKLHYPTVADIEEDKEFFRDIWDNREDRPLALYDKVFNERNTIDEYEGISRIFNCFSGQTRQKLMQDVGEKQRDEWWDCIGANACRHWLCMSKQSTLKQRLSGNTTKKKNVVQSF